MSISKITPCLWFDNQAEDAAKMYTSIFKNSKIISVTRYGKEGFEIHKQPEGTVMTVAFEIDGQPFTALNGGPQFKFNESISFQVGCDTQEEIDRYWEALSAVPESEQCGWLKDKYGVSWQIVPSIMNEIMASGDTEKIARVTQAFLKMKKFDIAAIQKAYEG